MTLYTVLSGLAVLTSSRLRRTGGFRFLFHGPKTMSICSLYDNQIDTSDCCTYFSAKIRNLFMGHFGGLLYAVLNLLCLTFRLAAAAGEGTDLKKVSNLP